jgi:hypothetical protein
MNSETPKDSASSSHHDDTRAGRPDDRETPGSLGSEALEPNQHQHASAGLMINTGGEPNYLMPHERKLSLSEQRMVLSGRRHVDVDDEVIEAPPPPSSGRRPDLAWEMHHRGYGLDAFHLGLHLAHQNIHAGLSGDSDKTHGQSLLLTDSGHPHKSLYDAVLHGVGNLDGSKVALSSTEQSNIAGALTAHMTQLPGFHRSNSDLVSISIASSEDGSRVFAINSQSPNAPGAMHTSVEIDQARGRSLIASSAQAMLSPAPEPVKPTQEQAQHPELHPPRVIA